MDASVAAMRAPRRGKAALNRLIQNRQVTSSGVKWLEVALDPFHDTEVVSDGYPDVTTTRSITQVVTKTMTVVAPAGLTTATWDAHVFFLIHVQHRGHSLQQLRPQQPQRQKQRNLKKNVQEKGKEWKKRNR